MLETNKQTWKKRVRAQLVAQLWGPYLEPITNLALSSLRCKARAWPAKLESGGNIKGGMIIGGI